MLLSDLGGRLLSLSPFSHKTRQGLVLDRHLGYVGYVKPHKLKCPLGDPSRGKPIPDNFSEPKRGYHLNGVTLNIMHKLVLGN
jgi:hypothetical protein